MSKEGRTRGNLHLTMDEDRNGDPHWSTELSPQGPNEKEVMNKTQTEGRLDMENLGKQTETTETSIIKRIQEIEELQTLKIL